MQYDKILLAAAAAAAALVSGCASVELDESLKAGTTQGEVAAVDAAAGAAQAAGANSVYFAFDSYAVDAQYLPVIERNARAAVQGQRKITVEGNTDARGSREYNLALGQRRSEAVKQRLQLLGVPASRIEAVSFGREKPVQTGDNEAAWAKNRRADIIVR
ncbi:MAG: OmpA family protein [Duodenibacillus sp.]|nr:OmpA family protein [Duodenibacillus sp.]